MVNLSFERKRKIQIYLVAALLIVCCIMLVACNKDISTSVEGDTVAEPTHFMAKLMISINKGLGGDEASFGWTVILFTVILRLILSPLDIWQKLITRKNSKAMERMKPQLEILQQKYAEDQQRLQQEQMALYKKEKYSMMGMCLPTIVSFVVFFVVFAGFRQMVGYQFGRDYKDCEKTFDASVTQQLADSEYVDLNADGVVNIDDLIAYEKQTGDGEAMKFYDQVINTAQQEVYNDYYSRQGARKWLWIKNIFVGDNWATAVPDFATVTGQKGFATSRLKGITKDRYELVMGKVLGTGGYGKNGKWNGLLILPVLSIALSFLSTKLMSKASGDVPQANKDAQGQSMKAMQWIMPIMMGVFGLLYSGAFALYMFTSSLMAILFQALFSLIFRLIDARRAVRK